MNSALRRENVLALSCITLGLMSAYPALANDTFNPRFLEQLGGSNVADLSLISQGGAEQLPGDYLVDIYVNGQVVSKETIKFSLKQDKSKGSQDDAPLEPCLSYTQLQNYGLRTEAFPELKKYADSPAQCEPFSVFEKAIPYAKSQFDFSQQRLNLSFPQASLKNIAQGSVDPSMWDEGIPALMMNYSFSGSNTTDTGPMHGHDDSYFLSLRSGINLGAWRLRNYSTMNSNNGSSSWKSINTYLQRDIIPWKSQMIMGDTYTPGDIFDSVQIRGAQLNSDDDMLPDSLRGFAPVVHGIARTNATVTIKQNGYVIYQSYVAPGPFTISDLYPTSASGDLSVEVKEADGSVQRFIQPFASVPVLRREGQIKYGIAAGEYRNGYSSHHPFLSQGSLIWGLPHGSTLYGGTQLAESYTSGVLGIGQNLGDIGAVSLDITMARSEDVLKNGGSQTGQSYRFLYAKSFAGSGTDFRLLGYRYSTKGYYTFQEAVDRKYQPQDYLNDNGLMYHKRSRLEGTITQQLGDVAGSLYVSASRQDYWDGSGTQTMLQVGYNNNWRSLNYGISYSRTSYPGQGEADQIVSLNMSLALSDLLPSSWATYNMTSQRHGPMSHQIGLSGTALEGNNLSYSVQESYGSQGQGNGGNASLNYQGGYGNMNLGYNYSRHTHQVNYGLDGGIVVHENGVTFSQPINDTAILVKAPGAANTQISSYTGVKTDWRGYAVLPYAQAYKLNHVELDTTTLGNNVELAESGKDAIPTFGAISRVEFATQVGYRALITLKQANGSVVPFGATAQLEQKKGLPLNSSIIGEGGQLFMSGLPESGKLTIQWGNQVAQRCSVNYQLPVAQLSQNDAGIIQMTADCR